MPFLLKFDALQVEQLVQKTCNYKQAYTQYGGLRPFGVAFLFAGWDVHHGYQVGCCPATVYLSLSQNLTPDSLEFGSFT